MKELLTPQWATNTSHLPLVLPSKRKGCRSFAKPLGSERSFTWLITEHEVQLGGWRHWRGNSSLTPLEAFWPIRT